MERLCMNTNTCGVQRAANTSRATDHCTAATRPSRGRIMEDQQEYLVPWWLCCFHFSFKFKIHRSALFSFLNLVLFLLFFF